MASRSSCITRQQLSVSLEELEMALDNAGVGATAKQLHAITDVKILAYKNFRLDGITKPIPFAMHIADAPLGRRIWACDNGLVISEPERGRVSIVHKSGARNFTLLPAFKWPTSIRTGFYTPLDAGHLALINYDFARWVNSVEPRSVHEGPNINHGDLITMLKSFHEIMGSGSRSSGPLSTATSKISYTEPSPHEQHPQTDAAVEGGGVISDALTVDTRGIKVRCDSMAAADLPTSNVDLQDHSRSTTTAEHNLEIEAPFDQPVRSETSQTEESSSNKATNARKNPGSTTLQKRIYTSIAELSNEIGEDLMRYLPGLSNFKFHKVPARFDEYLAYRLLFGKIRETKTKSIHRLWIYLESPVRDCSPTFRLIVGSVLELPDDGLGNDDNTDDDEIGPSVKLKKEIVPGMLVTLAKAGDLWLEAGFRPVYTNRDQLRAFAMYCFMLTGESNPLDHFDPEIPPTPSFTQALRRACRSFKGASFGKDESITQVEERFRRDSHHEVPSSTLQMRVDKAASITSLGSSYRTEGPRRYPVGSLADYRLGTGRKGIATASNMLGEGPNIRQHSAQIEGLHSPSSKQATSRAGRKGEKILASDVTKSGNKGVKIRSLPAPQTVQEAKTDSENGTNSGRLGTDRPPVLRISGDMDIDSKSPRSVQKPRPTNNTARVDHGSPTSNNANSDFSNSGNEIVPEMTFARRTRKKASHKRTHSSTGPSKQNPTRDLKRMKSIHISKDVSGQSNF